MTRLSDILLTTAVASLTFACQKDKADDKTKEPVTENESSAKPTASSPKHGDIPAPSDVAAPPEDAKKTDSGLAYKVLTAASAPGEKPGGTDTVEVHYTGWTTDGNMFDSSVKRGKPAVFPVDKVIAGWTEGVQLMTPGEKTRFWIPEKLAYEGQAGKPAGMLVFDVELLSVKKAPPAPDDVAAPPADAKKTKLGVHYKLLKAGAGGAKPNPWDKVKADYSGWTSDGTLVDSSITRGRAAEFVLSGPGIPPGWVDGLQLMSAGDSYRFWIPEEHVGPPGKSKGTLVFDFELHEITAQPKPPAAPEDVAAPPKKAKKTAKGVFYRVLKKGKGSTTPTETDQVEVHYSGWTTDGKLFDSSISRGKTASFPLTRVIPGWTDGLQTMTAGGKTRFWIPEELAYKGQPGKPAGMLVFDVELVAITPAAKPADKDNKLPKPAEAIPAKPDAGTKN